MDSLFRLSWAALLMSVMTSLVAAETHHLDWNVTWVQANPDGAFWRPVIGINNQWPPPVLNFTKGDRVIAHVRNGLGNQTTSIHWHGMFQNGTAHMDGPPMVSQCEIPIGSSVTYDFTLNQTGSYWYHSHSPGQYPEGLRQALVIQDPENPFVGRYDEERIITLSDWYHDQFRDLLKSFISYRNPTGAEPVPQSGLINDTSSFTMPVEPGKTYLLRFINVGAFASQYVWFENHTMEIVEVDGVWTEPTETKMLYITAAQRYSVLLTSKDDKSANYPLITSMDTSLFDTIPNGFNWNTTGHLIYDAGLPNPDATEMESFDPYDDFELVPHDKEGLLPEADYTVTLDLTMNNLGDGANYAFFNDITYTAPVVPTLYTALSAGANATLAQVYGEYTNPFVLGHGQVIDIVLNNDDSGKHPFHLHGHVFQVIHRSADNAGHWDPNSDPSSFRATPVRRDTVTVPPMGNFVVRFRADNPGVWFFHCHIQWHMDSGLAVTFVEAPLALQRQKNEGSMVIPQDFLDACDAGGVPTVGNAAGNAVNYLDLEGQNQSVAPLPDGFTGKGIVAMVFSCLAGFVGVAAIAWYGAAPIKTE